MQLYGRSIPTDNHAVNIRRLYCVGMEKFRVLVNECGFHKQYWAHGSIPAVEKSAYRDLYQVFLKDAIQYILTQINSFGVYDYDTVRISKIYQKYAVNYVTACEEVYADYCEIQGDAQAAKRVREQAKNNRGKFVGGGFGAAGAAKGIAMAGAANLATGALYSAGNMIGNTLSQMSADSQSDKLYRSPKTVKKLFDALQKDFIVGVDILEKILVSSQGPEMANPLTNQRLEKAKAIMNNIQKGIIPEAEQKKQLVETMVNDAPYYDELYFFAFETFGEDNGNLLEFAKIFGKDNIAERIKKKIQAKEHDQATEELERKVFGENYEIVQKQRKPNGKFTDFDDFYFYPAYGMYLDKGYPIILKRLCEDLLAAEELSKYDIQDLVLFDGLLDKREETIETCKTLCDPLKLFQPEETAYCFINLGLKKASKGILITSKGLYFSLNCKIEKPFISYDEIDGIVENSGSANIICENRNISGLAYINKKWARLLTFTILFFKYGDVIYTGKISPRISKEGEQQLGEIRQTVKKETEKTDRLASIIGLLICVAIIVFIFRSCGG